MIGWVIFTRSIASNSRSNQQSGKVEHVSSDLKISLEYPKGWYVDDRDMNLLLTNYPSSLNKDLKPAGNQLELFISNFSGCHSTIEEDLRDPGCGEGGPTVKPSEIISKDARETQGGTFYKYVLKSPNNQFTYYLLQKGDRVLQISKSPDPSQYEKEFDQIINSIRFLK